MRLNFLSLLILVIVVGAAVGGAYGAGVVMGKGNAPAASAAQSQGTAAAAAGQAQGVPAAATAATGFGAGASAIAGMAGRGLTGTIEKLEGNTLSIAAATGGTTQVTLSPDTSMQKMAGASREELQPGVRVMVTGQQGSGGNLVASSIQILAAEGAAASQTPRARPQGSPTPAR